MSQYLSLIKSCHSPARYLKSFLYVSIIGCLLTIHPARADLATCSSSIGLDCYEFSADNSESFVEQALSDALSQLIDVTLYGNSITDASLFSFDQPGEGGESVPDLESLNGSQNGSWAVLDGFEIDYISIVASNLSATSSTLSIYDVGASSSGLYSLDALNLGFEEKYFVQNISFWFTPTSIDEPATFLLILLGGAILIVRRALQTPKPITLSHRHPA